MKRLALHEGKSSLMRGLYKTAKRTTKSQIVSRFFVKPLGNVCFLKIQSLEKLIKHLRNFEKKI